jgi:hypothetical protein
VEPLRRLLQLTLRAKRTAEIQLVLADQGPDVALKGIEISGLEVGRGADGVQRGQQSWRA